jgi:ABC-2 type transport system permease protein
MSGDSRQPLSRLWSIAKKELLQNRRDPLAALFTLVLPVLFTVFLGLIIGSAETSGMPVALVDLDGGPAAQPFVEELGRSSLVELESSSLEKAEADVKQQKVAAAVVIPQGFGSAVEQAAPGTTQNDAATTLTLIRLETSSGAQSVWQAVQAAVAQTNAALLAAGTAVEQVSALAGRTPDAALVESARTIAAAQLAAPVATVNVLDAGTEAASHASGFDQSSSGSLVNWVLFSLLGIATTVVWERRRGLLRRLTTAGVKARELVGGKLLAMVIITFLQQLLLILLGQLAFGVDYFNSPAALVIIMVSLSLLAASFGLLISNLFRSEQAVIATTVISAQLLAALGGAWFPLEITSASFTRVAHVLPSAWVMDSLHGIILKDWGVAQVLYPMGIVWIWIVALFALAVWRYRPD